MITPKLSLDFTTGTVDPRITFTRAGYTAGYINSSGNLVVASPNQPRIDYDPVTGACNGLLIEESRSNLAVGDNLINAASLSSYILQLNATPAKSFKGYADKLVPTTANAAHPIEVGATVVSGSTYRISFIAKQAGYTKVFGWNNVSGAGWSFDLAAGTSTGTGATIKSVGDGFYLCSFPYTPGSTSGQVRLYVNSSSAFAGDGTSGVYVYGWQWELGSFATSRIYNSWNTTSTSSVLIGAGAKTFTITLDAANPLEAITAGSRFTAYTPNFANAMFGTVTSHTGTTLVVSIGSVLGSGTYSDWVIGAYAAGATRNADVATMTGTNFSDWWQVGKGGAQVQAIPSTVSGIRPLVQYDDGTSNEIIALRGNTTNPELYIIDGGSPQAQIDAGTILANTTYTLAGTWETNNCKARLNERESVLDSVATIPTVTQLRIGSDGTNYLNGHVAEINYYDRLAIEIKDGLALRGYTGTVTDMLLQYFKDKGATSNSFTDAENQFLNLKGFTSGTVTDKWFAYLRSLGYVGTVTDMLFNYWKYPA